MLEISLHWHAVDKKKTKILEVSWSVFPNKENKVKVALDFRTKISKDLADSTRKIQHSITVTYKDNILNEQKDISIYLLVWRQLDFLLPYMG